MSAAAPQQDSVAVNSRGVEQVTVERDITTVKEDSMTRRALPRGTERTDGQ